MHHYFRESFSKMSGISLTFDTNQNAYAAVLLCGLTTCTIDEACVQNMCVQRGSLSFLARWSRDNGQGHIIIRTPLNNTIYFGSPRTNSSEDENQYDQIEFDGQVDNIYWPSKSILSKGLYKICFRTNTVLNGNSTSSVTVTIQLRRVSQAMETVIRIFNTSTMDSDRCIGTNDTLIKSFSKSMFFLKCKLHFK